MDGTGSTEADLTLYAMMWTANDTKADLNGDRAITDDDMTLFMFEYAAGCD